MTGDRWTLLVLKDGASHARQLRLPGFVVRRAAIGLSALGLVLGTFLLTGAYQTALRHQGDRLEEEREMLIAELDRVHGRVQNLERQMAERVDGGDFLRLAAGLEPLDDEVLMVGIGGPEPPSLREHPLRDISPDLGNAVFAVSYDLNVLERRTQLLLESFEDAADSIQTHRDRFRSTPSLSPTTGWVSSSFGPSRVHPVYNRSLPHTGIDIAAREGMPIVASADGRVTRAGRWSGYGLTVELDHGHGYSTLYAHASEVTVEVGDRVRRGDVIARVGSTGLATGPHVHYEVQVRGRPENPRSYFVSGAIP